MPLLSDPYRLGNLLLKNRIVMAPLTRCRAGEQRIPNAMMVEYYRQRAGAGLIISEGTQISTQAIGYQNTPGIHSQEQVEGWKEVCTEVHQEGGIIFAQLWHTGRISHPKLLPSGMHPVAPSSVAAEGKIKIGEEKYDLPLPLKLSNKGVKETVRDYRTAGENAKAAGFDGVELHAANGYLPEQFLNDSSNLRTDEYGGEVDKRQRFILEILDELLTVFGRNRVGIRLSPSAARFGTIDSRPVETYSSLVQKLNSFPLAYLHLVEPLTPVPPGYLLQLLPHFKKIYSGTIITAGGYTPEKAHQVIEGGQADLVAFGRLFISNPDLPSRIFLEAPLNEPDTDTFYTGGVKGYTDYSTLIETH
jgi:N-ethylmaleimide reductase